MSDDVYDLLKIAAEKVIAQNTELKSELAEAREDLASERALADRLAENLKIACHAWNNPTEHPAITDWIQARNALAK